MYTRIGMIYAMDHVKCASETIHAWECETRHACMCVAQYFEKKGLSVLFLEWTSDERLFDYSAPFEPLFWIKGDIAFSGCLHSELYALKNDTFFCLRRLLPYPALLLTPYYLCSTRITHLWGSLGSVFIHPCMTTWKHGKTVYDVCFVQSIFLWLKNKWRCLFDKIGAYIYDISR